MFMADAGAKPQETGTETQAPPEIPDKLYFRIGEVSRLLGLQPYVLRYWETEFPMLAPRKSGSGHRLYRRKDVELLLEIKRLLYENRYTIEGAKRRLGLEGKSRESAGPPEQGALFPAVPSDAVKAIRTELASLLDLLSRDR